MTCHAQGMREHPNPAQLRDSVTENRGAYGAEEYRTLLALYADEATVRAAWKEDNERFAQAVEKCGGKLSETEQVATLAERFEATLNLKFAAAELGLLPAELAGAIQFVPALGRVLGVLRTPGGRVQRKAFLEVVGTVVTTGNRGGVHVPPTRRREVPPPGPVASKVTLDLGNGVAMTMVLVPAGSFQMGSNSGFPDERPVRKVQLGDHAPRAVADRTGLGRYPSSALSVPLTVSLPVNSARASSVPDMLTTRALSSSSEGSASRTRRGRASVRRYSATPIGLFESCSATSTTTSFFFVHSSMPTVGPSSSPRKQRSTAER
jgi:hypothetical protein